MIFGNVTNSGDRKSSAHAVKAIFFVLVLIVSQSVSFLNASVALETPTVRLIFPAITTETGMENTANDSRFIDNYQFQSGSRSIVMPVQMGKEVTIKYLVTKDGTNPWPGVNLTLLVGGAYSSSFGSWGWGNSKIGFDYEGFYDVWAGRIGAVTDLNGVATFSFRNLDTKLNSRMNTDWKNYSSGDWNSFWPTRFGLELPGYSNFNSPYFLQDVLTLVVTKPIENQGPSQATQTNQLTYSFSTSITQKPPKTIKWGKSFQISIKTNGKGGALCEMVFQNPGWPSRRGITTFRLNAGKTTIVTVRPWARLFLSYPLKYVCIPDGWPRVNSDDTISIYDKRIGESLGYVTIIP